MLLLVAGYVWVLICAREGVVNSEDGRRGGGGWRRKPYSNVSIRVHPTNRGDRQ